MFPGNEEFLKMMSKGVMLVLAANLIGEMGLKRRKVPTNIDPQISNSNQEEDKGVKKNYKVVSKSPYFVKGRVVCRCKIGQHKFCLFCSRVLYIWDEWINMNGGGWMDD